MKFQVFIFVIFCVTIDNWVQGKTLHRPIRAVQKYTTKYDNIDVERILHSKRLLMNYINCLLEKGSCSPEGRELKSKYLRHWGEVRIENKAHFNPFKDRVNFVQVWMTRFIVF
jgi:hypothetical protein